MENDIRVNLENLNEGERETLLKLIEKANKGRKLSEVPIGETFKVADIEFIHFGDGKAVAKDILFDSIFDGDTNDFSDSELLAKLEAGILYDIEETIGANNVLSFKTDLLALDGTSRGMYVESKISIPTLDFYRANREIFDKYCIDKCWWLATPDSTNDSLVCCVNYDGALYYFYCGHCIGVRPFLIFKSDIFVS